MQTRHDPRSAVTTATAEPTAPQPLQTSAPAAAPRKGLKKVSLGGIAKKESDTSNKYPVFPDETRAAGELAARIAGRQEQFDALISALETDKAELARVHIRPWYPLFTRTAGHRAEGDPPPRCRHHAGCGWGGNRLARVTGAPSGAQALLGDAPP